MADRIRIRNGNVFDPAAGSFERRDLCLADGRIVSEGGFEPDSTIDADGYLVTPGLIDLHVHAYEKTLPVWHDIDLYELPSGVTTAVDAGTSGPDDYAYFAGQNRSRRTRMFSLLSPVPEGQTLQPRAEDQNPARWDRDRIRDTIRSFPEEIVGFKFRQQDKLQEPFGLYEEHLEEGRKLADEYMLPLVLHVNDPLGGAERAAGFLNHGDIYCHMYAGARESILDEQGRIRAGILEARRRGVLFDACNGRGNFLFRNAVPALRQGFFRTLSAVTSIIPAIISSL